jgi:hypothetical protein
VELLLVKLPKTGALLLSGDLVHFLMTMYLDTCGTSIGGR